MNPFGSGSFICCTVREKAANKAANKQHLFYVIRIELLHMMQPALNIEQKRVGKHLEKQRRRENNEKDTKKVL